MLLVIILLILLFGFGGGIWGYGHYGMAGGVGPFGLILVFVLILWIAGVLPR